MPLLARSRARLASAAAVALLLLSTGCSSPAPTAGPDTGTGEGAPLQVTVVTMGLMVSTVTAEVTGADFMAPLVFNLPIANGVASGVIRVPPGSQRSITLKAYDEKGVVTHEGSAVVEVRPGTNPTVNITLRARAGQVPINGTIGSLAVEISGATGSLFVGSTRQYSARVIDLATQNELTFAPGDIDWAVSNPAFASVNATGLVTGVAPGDVFVSAIYEGVAGVRSLTVQAPGVGTVQGFVSSPQLGAIGGAQVQVTPAGSSSLTGTTIMDGSYAITGVPSTSVQVSLTAVPAACMAPGPQTVTVPNGGSVTVNFSVTCAP